MYQQINRKAGERVRVKQPANSYRLPDGLNDGDEVIILAPGYHSGGYAVEKDDLAYWVSCLCVPHEHVTLPDGPATSATRAMRGYG